MKMISLTNAARERGISLIEAVLYLVIALAVIVGGIVFFQQAQLSSSVTDTARAGVSISSETRGLYQNQRSFGTGDITSALVSAGAVPSNFQDDAGNIVHPFDGTVRVDGNVDGFAVTFVDFSEAACLRLGSVGEGKQGQLGTGIEGLTIAEDNTTLFPGTGTTPVAPATLAPVTAATLQTACSAAADIDMTVFYNR